MVKQKRGCACRPVSPQQTYLTIGQDLFSIGEYLREQYNASLHELVSNNASRCVLVDDLLKF